MRLSAIKGCETSTASLCIAWEECACLLCGSKSGLPLLEAVDPLRIHGALHFLIVKCPACGLCFTNPRPDVQTMQQFYPPSYPCHQSKPRNPKAAFRKADTLRRWLPLQGEARLLDVGCGAGDFLVRMQARGWDVLGLDSSAEAVQRVSQQHGLKAQQGSLPCSLWADASFEAITMWQTLEHLHHPLQALCDAYRLLIPGGRLLVTVPNLASFSSAWFGVNWYGLDLPRHLTHFTPRTLRAMLQRAGFAKIDLHQERHGSWIRHSADLAEQSGERDLSTRWLRTRLGSGLAGRWREWRGQAESILALATK